MLVHVSATRFKGGVALDSFVEINDFSAAELARLNKGQTVVRHVNAGFYLELCKYRKVV